MKIILNNIKNIRWELGITVEDLAVKSGLSKSTINRIENGKRIPNQVTIILISKALEKPAEDIFILDWISAEI